MDDHALAILGIVLGIISVLLGIFLPIFFYNLTNFNNARQELSQILDQCKTSWNKEAIDAETAKGTRHCDYNETSPETLLIDRTTIDKLTRLRDRLAQYEFCPRGLYARLTIPLNDYINFTMALLSRSELTYGDLHKWKGLEWKLRLTAPSVLWLVRIHRGPKSFLLVRPSSCSFNPLNILRNPFNHLSRRDPSKLNALHIVTTFLLASLLFTIMAAGMIILLIRMYF